ncbi:class I SAM-dependent RNA methyltransferase, partial [Candidatus Omnitrophota bacterium]
EQVRFIRQSEKKNFITGLSAEILKPSSNRREPLCPYFGRCGGCQYQHLDYKQEVLSKADQVQEILAHIAGLSTYRFEGIEPCVSDYGYRSSITLHKSGSGYGYFARDNQTIIAIKQCPLARDELNSAIGTLTPDGNRENVTLKSDQAGKVWISNYPGQRFYKDEFLGTELTFSPLAFSQVNRQIAVALVERLRQWMEEEPQGALFDLYCGVGFFSFLLRRLYESVVGLDQGRIAIACAKTSKKDLNLRNVSFYHTEVDQGFTGVYQKLHGKINTILLDPPRSGISRKLAQGLSELKDARSLYYVSCNPAILARDAKLLTASKAWALTRLACFDMFARTKHIESIALFKRL